MTNYRTIIYIILLLFFLLLAIEVMSVPNYQGGRSYVSYSPDGRYKIDSVYPQKVNSKSVRIVTSLSNNEVEAIVPLSKSFEGSINPMFMCTQDNSRCYQHTLGVDEEIIPLPPLPWAKLHAWLVITLNNLEEPNLQIVKISKKYPPVSKK